MTNYVSKQQREALEVLLRSYVSYKNSWNLNISSYNTFLKQRSKKFYANCDDLLANDLVFEEPLLQLAFN